MPSVLAQSVLFVSSYVPLLAVFAVLDSFEHQIARWACVAAGVVAAVSLWVLVRLARASDPDPLRVHRSRRRDGDAVGYVVTYLLPFLGIPTDTAAGQLALAIFFLTVAVLYVRAQLFYVNPLLAAAGFRLFEIESGDQTVVVLSPGRRTPRGVIPVHRLANDVFLGAG